MEDNGREAREASGRNCERIRLDKYYRSLNKINVLITDLDSRTPAIDVYTEVDEGRSLELARNV